MLRERRLRRDRHGLGRQHHLQRVAERHVVDGAGRQRRVDLAQRDHSSGLAKGGGLTVTAGPDGGTVECTVTVEGKPPVVSTFSGPFSTANCAGF